MARIARLVDASDVVVGMENGQPRWVTINGTRVDNVVDMDITLEHHQVAKISMNFMATNVTVVPHNVHDPKLAEVREALGLGGNGD